MKKVVETIGKMLVDKLFDFDNNGYEITNDFYERENGIHEPASLHISFYIEVGGHAIDLGLGANRHNVEYVEIEFEDGGYENLTEALTDYVKAELDKEDIFYLAEDYTIDGDADEFQRNGFANAADYWHYRCAV